MKKILFTILIFSTSLAFGQIKPSSVVKAEAAFNSGKYFEAADLCVKAYQAISPRNAKALKLKTSLAYKAGYSFERIINDEKAIEWYQRAIDLKHFNYNPYVYFRLGNMYKKKGDYDKAKDNYEAFLKLQPGDKQVENALQSIERAVVMKDNRTRYTVKSEKKINTDGMDMAPTVIDTKSGTIVYGSTRSAAPTKGKDPITGEGFFNIWEASKDKNGNWEEPKLFGADSINTSHSEGTMVFDGRGRTVFFTRCPSENKKNLGCEIWMMEKKGRNYGMPTKIPLAENDTISVGHPLPNEDGTMLIFASDMPGGFGGKDLWYTEYDRREKTWSKPINLGPEINTSGDELFPTYALNGDLFFSSDGHRGLGGLDIYRAEKTDNPVEFTNIKNLGTPINSDANDYHISEVDKRNGYFTSNRAGSMGTKSMPDIWSYELPPNLFDLKVIVTEVGKPKRVVNAPVEVTPEGTQVFMRETNNNGEVFWDRKPDGDRYITEETDFTVRILPTEGYHNSTDVEFFSTKDLEYDQNFIIEMSLIPQTPIVLPEVRYDLASAVLQVNDSVNSKDSLNFVYDLLEEYPGMVLKLISHTDSRGSDKSNELLAQRRSQSCVNYLVNERGVDANRLVAVGKGEYEPRIIYLKDDTYYVDKPSGDFEAIELKESYINQFKNNRALFEKLHQYNRRTEAEIVRMDYNTGTSEEDEESDN